LFDDICKRSLKFIQSCMTSDNRVVNFIARHGVFYSRMLSVAQTVLGVYLKRTCSRVTSASSALGVLKLTIMRYTNPRTHSLTHRRATQRKTELFTERLYFLYCALVITTTDHSNRSDSPHPRRGTDRSNVFARRRHCEHQSNGHAWFLGPTRVCPPQWHLDRFSRYCNYQHTETQAAKSQDMRRNSAHLAL